MNESLKQQIEDAFENVVKEAIKINPIHGTPFDGLLIYHAIATATDNFKKMYKAEKYIFGLTESEVDVTIDEISAKIINKYIDI